MRAKLNELRKNKKGFTLMELIVVIVIIGILTAVLVPGIISWIGKAKEVQLETEARNALIQVQGEVLERFKTMDASHAISAAMKEDALTAALKRAGLDGDNAVVEILDWDDENGTITCFTYKAPDASKKLIYKDKRWTLPSDTEYDTVLADLPSKTDPHPDTEGE